MRDHGVLKVTVLCSVLFFSCQIVSPEKTIADGAFSENDFQTGMAEITYQIGIESHLFGNTEILVFLSGEWKNVQGMEGIHVEITADQVTVHDYFNKLSGLNYKIITTI